MAKIANLDKLVTAIRDDPEINGKNFRIFMRHIEQLETVVVPDSNAVKAIKMFLEQYEKSRNADYVQWPVAHALYHTWKRWGERR